MPRTDLNLDRIVQETLKEVLVDSHDPEINISVALEVNPGNQEPQSYKYHLYPEDFIYYPASLIKLFNAYFAKLRIQTMLKEIVHSSNPESDSFGSKNILDDIYEAIDTSLRFSDNDALSLLLDFNTETTSGLRLDPKHFERFKNARALLNTVFVKKGYSQYLNLSNKCFSFGPYGRDAQLVFDANGLGRNIITIEDVFRILKDISSDFPELLQFMKREVANHQDEQCQFIARGLEQYKDKIENYYSKAGWTSKVRHDAALIDMKDSTQITFVIMTKNLSGFVDLIPVLTKKIFESLI